MAAETENEIIMALSPVISYRCQDIITLNVSISQTTTEPGLLNAKTWLKSNMFDQNKALKLSEMKTVLKNSSHIVIFRPFPVIKHIVLTVMTFMNSVTYTPQLPVPAGMFF